MALGAARHPRRYFAAWCTEFDQNVCFSFSSFSCVFTALVAGGVTGAILAAMLMAVLIYQMQNNHEEGPIIPRKKDEGYHIPNRKVIV